MLSQSEILKNCYYARTAPIYDYSYFSEDWEHQQCISIILIDLIM